MSPTQIHRDLCETSGESAVSSGIAKMWCSEFRYGSESCEGQHAGGPWVTVTIQENVSKSMIL